MVVRSANVLPVGLPGEESVSTVDVDIAVHPLDDPVRASLRGKHSRFARWTGRIGRY